MTLKNFLKTNGINLTNSERAKLGYRVASIWNCNKMGKKDMVKEDNYEVIDYPINYLESETVIKYITKFLTKQK